MAVVAAVVGGCLTGAAQSRCRRRRGLGFPGLRPACWRVAVSAKGVDGANERLEKIGIFLGDLRESFTRSSGPGGQNVNKVETCVELLHVPTGIRVTAQTHRTQLENRVSARRRLEEKYAKEVLGRKTKGDAKAEKIRRKKNRAKRRAKKRESDAAAQATVEDGVEGENVEGPKGEDCQGDMDVVTRWLESKKSPR